MSILTGWRLPRAAALACGLLALPSLGGAQAQQTPPDSVRAIAPPRRPLPPEAASADVTRFSFIAYGDTRGRRDGVDPQYEHSLVVESMLRTIAAMDKGPDPVKFVVQSGDAVVDGRNARQWNASFVGLVNRLTTEAGVPYFLAPGNHDVTSSMDPAAPGRQTGLRNTLDAVAQLIPPAGTARRLAGYDTYAFGYGNTFVLAFDSNIAADTTQLAWVRSQLEGLDRKRYVHIVAVFHHPVFSSGPHGAGAGEPQTLVVRERYMPLFRKHGVRLLITGHEHFFEHWAERYREASGKPGRIDQIVTGGGGAPLYGFQGLPDLRAYVAAAAADSVRDQQLVRPGSSPGENPYHYVVVHVDGPKMWLEVVGVDWGRDYRPYRGSTATLADPATSR